MHIRSRVRACDLRRAQELRACGSLGICLALGAAISALGMYSPSNAPCSGKAAAPACTAWQGECLPESPVQVLPSGLPPLVPELPEASLPELAGTGQIAAELPDLAYLAEGVSPAPATAPYPAELPEIPEKHQTAPAANPEHPIAAATPATTPPAYKNAPAPPYPPSLKANRIEGSVRVRIEVAPDGKPLRVEILAGSGHREFDTCARDWILKHWLFTPAHKGGAPIAGAVTTSVRFVLR